MNTTLIFSRWNAILPVLFCTVSLCIGQNLVPNPGFETYSACPSNYGNGGPLVCEPWINGNMATADYFNTCATSASVQIPTNLFGSQPTHNGNGYAGFYARESFIWREYLQAPLLQPLVAGFSYEVSFYVSLADLHCGVTHIGAYLSATPPDPNTIGPLAGTPQIEASIGYVNDKDNWVLITGCYAATGGEQYITIGNFYNNPSSPIDPNCSSSNVSYYYLDDVSVEQGDPVNTLPLDLGNPVIACDSYVINPGVSGVDFHWSDGSTGPTLTVTQSGTYSLTITSGCGNFGEDEIEITINGSAAPVDLGPPNTTICNGQSIDISLDPAAGDYTWQDGSTNPNYSISTPGVYQVTLDDGCDVTTDQITVSVLNSPDPFTLGMDASLCEGNIISFSFDPSLGNFHWQDNSVSPDYTINTGGSYSLTISNQCGEVTDDIFVTAVPLPFVDLGPADVSICSGQNITFSLNPAIGTYEWQDGSMSLNYPVSIPGTYAVTVTNSCGTANDQIIVNVADPPAPFSLGNDAGLCLGNNIQFNFDPTLGNFHWQDNSTSSNYSITTGGAYQLTISNICGAETDEIIVTDLPTPAVDLGFPQQAICEGQQLNFTLDPNVGSYVWQDGNTSPDYSISLPGTYAVTVTNACGTISDGVDVTIIGEPVFDLGPDLIICPAQLPVLLDVSDVLNATVFHWQDNSTSPQLLVTDAGSYSVTVSNTCFSLDDQIQVVVQDAIPAVTLPADQTLCPAQSIILDGNGLIGDYVWQDGSTGSSFFVNQPGTYSLTISNQCGASADTVVINYTDPIPSPDLGPDFSLCPGEQFTLHQNIPGINYTWQDMSHADSMVVSGPGIYTLVVSNACGSASDTVTVSMNGNPPAVNLPDTIHLCTGNVTTIFAGVSGVQYLWNDGSQGSFIMAANPGIYSITVSNSCGNDSDSVLVVSGGTAPFVELNADISICPGEIVTLSPVSSNVISWLWQDDSTASTFNVSSAGKIRVEVSNACGISSDSINVNLSSSVPTLDLGIDTSICPGEVFTLSVNIPDVNIVWNNGSTNTIYTVENTEVVSASISNQCGTSYDTIFIDQLPGAPLLNLGADQSLCPGETIHLSPGIPGVNYIWQDGSIDSTFNATEPGLAILTIQNSCGSAVDTLEIITDTNGPQVNLGNDIIGCEGDVINILSGISGVDYLWQDGSTGPDFSTSVSGQYILQVSNACGMDIDTVLVDIHGQTPSISLGKDTLLCEGSVLHLHADVDAETAFQWQDGSSNPVLNVTTPGEYILSESNHCGNATDTINVLFKIAPLSFELGPDTILCTDAVLVLTAPVTSDLITWQDGSHADSLVADSPQLYTLELSNQCGQVKDSLRLRFDDRVPLLEIENKMLDCSNEMVTLDAMQIFDAEYLWNTGSTFPAIEVNSPGLFSVTVTTQCQSVEQQVEILQNENCDHEIYVPNVFSPNGDQRNDLFTISFSSVQDISQVSCSIFDRWGNLVYRTQDINFTWDGRFKGEWVQSGVYAYLIQVTYRDGSQKKLQGDVTVVH